MKVKKYVVVDLTFAGTPRIVSDPMSEVAAWEWAKAMTEIRIDEGFNCANYGVREAP